MARISVNDTQHSDESESQATVLFLTKSIQNKTKIIIDEIVCHLFRYLYQQKYIVPILNYLIVCLYKLSLTTKKYEILAHYNASSCQ